MATKLISTLKNDKIGRYNRIKETIDTSKTITQVIKQTVLKCLNCGNEWTPKCPKRMRGKLPVECPKCKSMCWNIHTKKPRQQDKKNIGEVK